MIKATLSSGKRLQVGQIAPDFTVQDVHNGSVALTARTSEYVLVAFLRYSGCPYCNLAVHRLSLEFPMLQANNCDVIAFMQSHAEDVETNIYGRHDLTPPFPIVADYEKHVFNQYGVESSKKIFWTGQMKTLPYWIESVGKHGWKQEKFTGDNFLVPAMFLVRVKDRRIMIARYGTSYYDHEAFTDLYETLNFGERL